MLNNDPAAIHLPDSGTPPLSDTAQFWLYARTQWRRLFGLNVSRVDELLFVGGEFSPAQWPDLRSLGIRAVLSLQAEREDRFDGTPPDRTLRLPVEDFHPPTIAQLRDAVAFIGACHADGLPVLIHCHAGVGRASLTASAYLMTHGLSYTQAFSRIKRARPIVELSGTQLERLIEWERLLRAQPAPKPQTSDPPPLALSVDIPLS
ncbi:MAG TPA: dual specificity protein phosphatase [Roseiflexaceae bacterium]